MYTKDNIIGVSFLAQKGPLTAGKTVYKVESLANDSTANLSYYVHPRGSQSKMTYGLRDILECLNDESWTFVNESITYQIY